MSTPIKPTESELEILQVLWQKNNATVREVHEVLCMHKDSGYTTTLKLMQIMHDKGLVSRDDSSKTHVYRPNISREATQQQLLHKMMNTLFEGNATQLVMQALGSQKPSNDELQAIEQLIQQMKQSNS